MTSLRLFTTGKPISLGSSYDGWGGLFILSVNEQGQEEALCEVTWSMEGTESVSVVTAAILPSESRPHRSGDHQRDGTCDSTGFVAAEYEGRSQVLAYRSGLLLYQDEDGHWFVLG